MSTGNATSTMLTCKIPHKRRDLIKPRLRSPTQTMVAAVIIIIVVVVMVMAQVTEVEIEV